MFHLHSGSGRGDVGQAQIGGGDILKIDADGGRNGGRVLLDKLYQVVRRRRQLRVLSGAGSGQVRTSSTTARRVFDSGACSSCAIETFGYRFLIRILQRRVGADPLPFGQLWAISPGGQGDAIGLFRIEVTESSGSGVHILNQSPPNPFRESVRIAEQNMYSRARELVGDRDPREHEFAVQLRSFDAAKNGAQLGVGVLLALCSALLGKPLKGGLAITGGVTLGGSIEPIHNPIDVVELALEKGAVAVLMPVSCRRALIDLSDDVATKVQVLFYGDAADALRKAVHE
jgi:hypothetical protein